MDLTALISIAFISILFLTLLSVGYDYLLYFRKREHAVKKREESLSRNSQELLEHAHHRSTILLAKSTEVAEKMILQSEFLHTDIQQKVENALAKVVEDNKALLQNQSSIFDKSYSQDLTRMREEYLKLIQGVVLEIRTTTEKELRDFMNVIMKETITAQTFMGKKVSEEFEAAQKEIEGYKADQIKKIDESVKKAVIDISQKVLGKAITVTEHEKLVLKALDDAKREGMFVQ